MKVGIETLEPIILYENNQQTSVSSVRKMISQMSAVYEDYLFLFRDTHNLLF